GVVRIQSLFHQIVKVHSRSERLPAFRKTRDTKRTADLRDTQHPDSESSDDGSLIDQMQVFWSLFAVADIAGHQAFKLAFGKSISVVFNSNLEKARVIRCD